MEEDVIEYLEENDGEPDSQVFSDAEIAAKAIKYPL